MRKFFGTDGVRGQANIEPMTPETILKIAISAGSYFKKDYLHSKVIIGKDTRLSGYMIETALTSGFTSVGLDVLLLGPIPTPAVGMLTRTLRANLGVMISASHNPYQDNGIKLFGPNGYKLTDEIEQEIEEKTNFSHQYLAPSQDIGKAIRLDDAPGRYIEMVKNTFPRSLRLDGLKIVIDCANGAGYRVAPDILFELGAEVITIGNEPNGFNINESYGTMDPTNLQKTVLENKADLGIALDGDADRLTIVDNLGYVVSNDHILGLIIKFFKDNVLLKNPHVVGTIFSNGGLENFINSLELKFHRTPVGDRYVIKTMRELQSQIGGEQSGHIILSDYSTTGDGLIAALQVLAVMIQKEIKASEISSQFSLVPQKVASIKVLDKSCIHNANLKKTLEHIKEELKGKGRLIVRASGTEPKIRIMIESQEATDLDTFYHIIFEQMDHLNLIDHGYKKAS